MVEYFQLLLTLGALLVVLLGIMALLMRFFLAPLMALFAIPTYAAMIALEYFIGEYTKGRCPEFLKFKRPNTYWKKVCMDFSAMYCTLVGSQIAFQLFSGLQAGKKSNDGFAQIITHASDSEQFFIIALFWAFLAGTYIASYFHGDNPNHPINKLGDLVVPEWVKDIIEKIKG
jgi:hypothetical protein